MLATMLKKLLSKRVIYLVSTLAIFALIKEEISAPLFYYTLRGQARNLISNKIYIPPSLDASSQRRLSGVLNLGEGKCEYELPEYEVPDEIEFHKTLVAGYPSGDKRMIFLQMEALTGWAAKDEWDFQFLGPSNHPFIKANYPHHEGIWGWGDVADQMVLMIRNMRRSLVEYHDILWDIDYAKTWEIATVNMDDLYAERPPLEDFYVWRDDRVMDEVHWYGWEIDYWMEGGLLREMFTHGITTKKHFDMVMDPVNNHRYDLEVYYAENVAPGVANGTITGVYDDNCAKEFITDGCAPVAVLSAERLRDYRLGPAETESIANVLLKDSRTGQFVIDPEAWDCVWSELIMNGQGLKTVYDRPNFVESDYNFSEEMLDLMIHELNRLITKYGSPEWNTKATANRIVELLTEHRALIQIELDDVISGVRLLNDGDFLGQKERERRSLVKGDSGVVQERKDYTEYFNTIWQSVSDKKGVKHQEKILAETKSRMDAANEAGKMKEFIESLANALSRIQTLEPSGKMDHSTVDLLNKVKQMVVEARLLMANRSDEE